MNPMAGPKCPDCRKIYDAYSASVFVADLEKLVGKKHSDEIKNVFKYVSGLRNEKGGAIVIHAKKHEFLDKFDQKVDDVLNHLIPDGSMYHDVYDRNFFDSTHLVYRVKPSPRNKPKSTVDFHCITSNNKGRADPTHQQMQTLIEQLCEKPTPDHECRVPDLNITFVNTEQVSIQRGYGDEPFHESMNIQAKALHHQTVRTGKELAKHCWKELKVREYISAFTKIKDGGVIYLGVSEHKTKSDEWETAVPDCNTVVELVGTSHADGWRIWKQTDTNKPPAVFFVAKEDNVKRKEMSSGVFETAAIALNSTQRREFRYSMLQKVDKELKWAGEKKPQDKIVQVIFHEVSQPSTSAGQANTVPVHKQHPTGATPTATTSGQQPSTSTKTTKTASSGRPPATPKQQGATLTSPTSEHCVIEIQIRYYHGICFYDESGPLSYKCLFQKSGGPFPKPDLKEIGFSEWVNSFKEKAAEKIKDTF